MSFDGTSNEVFNKIPYISLSYSNADSQTSALRLILTVFPDWEHSDGKIDFVRFKDGITNTVCLPFAFMDLASAETEVVH